MPAPFTYLHAVIIPSPNSTAMKDGISKIIFLIMVNASPTFNALKKILDKIRIENT